MIDFFDDVDIFFFYWLVSFKFSPYSYVLKNTNRLNWLNTGRIRPWVEDRRSLFWYCYCLWVRLFGRL